MTKNIAFHSIWTHRESLVREVSSVEHIVLEHEENVKYDREEAQTELGGVSEQTAPVVIVVGDEKHLEHAEAAACEVQQDVANTPAHSALSSVKEWMLNKNFENYLVKDMKFSA